MQLRLKIPAFLTILMLMMVLNAWAGAVAPPQSSPDADQHGPQAVFAQTQYKFEPLLEGEDVKHDFVVENKGDAPLVIKDVRAS